MHKSAYEEMAKFVETLSKEEDLRIADVGAYDVNGCLRPLFKSERWEYVGIDMAAGPNVDVVASAPEDWQNIGDSSFDVVVSVSTLEHTKRPWRVMAEMARILRPGGKICVIAPTMWPEHRYPMDCWRILPDGMKVLFQDSGLVLERIHTRPYLDHPCCEDVIATGRRPV